MAGHRKPEARRLTDPDVARDDGLEDQLREVRADLTLEQSARPMYQEAIAYCENVRDYITRELLEAILQNEEEHIDWLETQLGLIDGVGLQNYLQSNMYE